MAKKPQKKIDHILSEIKRISKKLGNPPGLLTKAQFFKEAEKVTEWDVRSQGGFNSIIKTYFPVSGRDLAQEREQSELRSYVSKLERSLGSRELFEQKLLESIEKHITPVKISKAPKLSSNKGKLDREVVVMLNDMHYGLNVDPAEINGINSYGWKEACRRTAFVIKQAVEYKPEVRNQVNRIHLVVNGDVLAGVIHGLPSKTIDQIVHHVNGATHILVHSIERLLSHYREVKVTMLPGNHDDIPHKRESGGRSIIEKYDSFANMAFFAVSAAFRGNKRVSFNIPKSPTGSIQLPGGRALITHGDTVFSKQIGNPGGNINVNGIGNKIREWNAGEVAKGLSPYKLVLVGHTHVKANFDTQEGVEVYIAPSLSGTDGYAHGAVSINHNNAGQLIFESTPKHILGDSRLIRVTEADNDATLDDIIPMFNRSLNWE